MTARDWTPEQVRDGLQARTIVLIDVREPQEYGAERIHGALNFPLSTFDPSSLPVGSDRQIVLHCAAGKRSAMALAKCADAGLPVAAHLAGGLHAWKSAGLPTVVIDPATGRMVDRS